MDLEQIKQKYNKELATLQERKRNLVAEAKELSTKLGLDFSTLTPEQLEAKIKELTTQAEESEKKLQQYIENYEASVNQ